MKNQKGFTLPELIITMGILSILFGFVAVNLIHLQRRSSLTTTVDTLVSDLYSQQNKAMVGDTQGSGTISDYGVYFESNRYVLFRGSSYDPSDITNFPVNLDPSLTFTNITFPSSSIVFSRGGGDVSGWTSVSDSVVLDDTTNTDQKTIETNVYGTITVQ